MARTFKSRLWCPDDGLLRVAIDRVVEQGVQLPDSSTYISLVKRCSSARALSLGKKLHAHISAVSVLDGDTYLGNHLVQMYGSCGCPKEALLAYEKIREPDLVSVNLLISAFAQNGYLQEARYMFERIPEPNTVSWNSIITAYGQHGDVLEARKLFDKMSERDLVSWNAMLAAYTQNGRYKEAVDLVKLIDLEGVRPNKVTFVSALNACGNLMAVVEGRTVYEKVAEHGYETDVYVGTALISMLGKFGNLKKLKQIFDRLVQRNVVTWTAMFWAYAVNGRLYEAKYVFDCMPRRNVVSWNALMAAYGQHGLLDELVKTFQSLEQRDDDSWGTLVSAYVQNEQNKEALHAFKLMDLEGFQPSKLTFLAVLEACGKVSALREGRIINWDIGHSALKLDVTVQNTVLSMYGKCGSMKEAVVTFWSMLQRDSVSWSTIVSGYAHNGMREQALEMLFLMNLEGMNPDETTFLSILSVCGHVGMFKEAREHFVSMLQDFGLQQRLEHYVCMVDALARSGRLSNAECLVRTMPFEPNLVSCWTLLGACKMHNNLKTADFAAKEAFASSPVRTSSLFATLSGIIPGVS